MKNWRLYAQESRRKVDRRFLLTRSRCKRKTNSVCVSSSAEIVIIKGMKSLLFIVLANIAIAIGQVHLQKTFEFEDALPPLSGAWQWRSNASNSKTLRMKDEQGLSEVRLTLCVSPYRGPKNVTVSIDNIRYSNDGPSDTVHLRLNNLRFLNFTTQERWHSGHEWNVFRDTGHLGPGLNLGVGQYVLSVLPKTDSWGLELDYIRFNINNQDPRTEFVCDSQVYFRTLV